MYNMYIISCGGAMQRLPDCAAPVQARLDLTISAQRYVLTTVFVKMCIKKEYEEYKEYREQIIKGRPRYKTYKRYKIYKIYKICKIYKIYKIYQIYKIFE